MKVLRAELRFHLPDDFEGNAAAALRAAADFLEDPARGIDDLPSRACFGGSHLSFFLNAREHGIRLTGNVSVYHGEEPAWRWNRVDTTEGMPRVHFDPLTERRKAWLMK